MSNWNIVSIRNANPFSIHIEWAPLDAPLKEVFDQPNTDILEARCSSGIDTAYTVRVRVMNGECEMSSITLDSCYAMGVTPEQDIVARYADSMMDQATEEAIDLSKKMLLGLQQYVMDTDLVAI